MILLEMAVAEWVLGIMFETVAVTIPVKQFWAAVACFGTSIVPPFFFLFAVEYNHGQNRFPAKTLILILIVPILTTVMAFTNQWHHLLWTNIHMNPGSTVAIYGHGSVWWISYLYEYILILGALYYLFDAAFKSGSFYTPQNLSIIIGAILPIIGNLFYVFGPNPAPGVDWAPVGFALSGVVLTWGILYLKLFKLTPIAHTLLVENMVDSMIILDTDNQIVDINPASAVTFQCQPKQMIGQKIDQFIPSSAELDKYLASEGYVQTEIDLGNIQPERKFELRLSTLYDRHSEVIGKIVVLRDVTEMNKNEKEREKLVHNLQEALNQVKTLNGLLPICSNCKKIRDDQGYWRDVEIYIQNHSDIDFSHGICPECLEKYYPDIAARIQIRHDEKSG